MLAALGGLVLLSVLYKVVLLGLGGTSPSPRLPDPAFASLPGSLDQFAAGIALAVVSVARQDRTATRHRGVARRRDRAGRAQLARSSARC